MQTTIDGREVPAVAPDAPRSAPPAPVRLFDAPQTMRGQLAMATDCAVCAHEGRTCTYCATIAFGAKLAARERSEDLAAHGEVRAITETT
jgi:hypothetical protein